MFNLTKRINRKTYWLGLGLVYLAWVVFVGLIAIYPFSEETHGKFEPFPDIPLILYALAAFWFSICLTRQRANDISGNHSLLWFFFSIFLIGPIIGLIPGQKSNNQYGASTDQVNLFGKFF